jgi:ATP/maltotriose-dependent transcriptional regulator MalT
MTQTSSIELATEHAIEGKRALLGHWVAASVEPLQSCLQTLHHLEVDEGTAPAVNALRVETLALLGLALDAGASFDAAAQTRQTLERLLAEGMDPLGEVVALSFMSCAAQLRGDVTAMLSLAQRSQPILHEREAWPAAAPHHALLGWALVMDGEVDEGLDALETGWIHHRRHGSVLSLPWMLTVCAEARLAAGAMEEARRDIDAAHDATSAHSGNGFLHGAAWRVRGNLRWAAGEGLAAAQQDWEQALAIDQVAGALLCELQTEVVFGRALAASGRKSQAKERVAAVLGRLGEGALACPTVEIARRQLTAWA